MKISVKVIEVAQKPGGGHSYKAVGAFQVEGRNDDELRQKAAEKLAAREIRSVSRGPRGVVIYIKPRRLAR